MNVARLNLDAEWWQLIKLLIALLQPLLVLLLIGGLVLASAHLLTMLGTRWGDRRASSKAMLFSVGVHLLLLCGLVALIPEYRAKLFTQVLSFDQEPIRVTLPEPITARNLEAGRTTGQTTPLFDLLPTTPPADWSRLDAPAEVAPEESPLQRRIATPAVELEPIPDVAVLPNMPSGDLPSLATPQASEMSVADTGVQPERVQRDMRPDATLPQPTRDRAAVSESLPGEMLPAARPVPEGTAMDAPSASPDRSRPEIASIPLPLPVQPPREQPSKAPAQIPESTPEQPAPLERSVNEPADASSSAEGRLTRTPARSTVPSMESAPSAPAPLRSSPPVVPDSVPSSRDRELPPPSRVESPQLARQEDPFSIGGRQDPVPSAYSLRTDAEREQALLQFGGSAETEAAVERSLKWLASVQRPEGYWDASDHGALQMGVAESGQGRQNLNQASNADVGVTALAVLAFLGKLHTVDQGEYSPEVNRALRWLVANQTSRDWGGGRGHSEGYLGGDASEFEGTYCHAMATFALGEAYAMSRNNAEAQWLRAPLERAVSYIVETQIRDGGWRYLKGQPDGDMSIFGWQVMALRSAEAAGVSIPHQTRLRMVMFLNDRKLGRAGGLATYRHVKQANGQLSAPTPAMTAEALYCRQMLGVAQDTAANREAVEFLLQNLPRRTVLNYYYWYYGTLALYQQGGPEWEAWNIAIRELLVSEQRQTGPLAGSWDPRDTWGIYGGRIYSTAIATLSLEVYYRYLPLYRLNEE